nr:hypothetical protein [Desulfobacula sp.]
MLEDMVKDGPGLNKLIAWNGVSFNIPVTWELESLDDTHLMAGENGSPRVEIKWAESPRSISFEKQFKSVTARSQKLLNIIIHEQPGPPFFSSPVPFFKFFFFSWEGSGSKGMGALIFCTRCRRLTLIRFFFHGAFSPESIPSLVLASFTDHPVAGRVSWRVFGMAFSTPAEFRLSDYSFKPGYFFFTFLHRNIRLTVSSWGPASFLLSRKTPAEFAKERLPGLSGAAKEGACGLGSFLEWSFRREPFKNAGRLPFFSRYSRFILSGYAGIWPATGSMGLRSTPLEDLKPD